VALLIVFALVRPALRASATAAAAQAARVHVVADEALPRAAAPALEAPRNSEHLDGARTIAKQNPAAVANIVRTWVKGDAV
jgi:flagellar M-ring protein FliF